MCDCQVVGQAVFEFKLRRNEDHALNCSQRCNGSNGDQAHKEEQDSWLRLWMIIHSMWLHTTHPQI